MAKRLVMLVVGFVLVMTVPAVADWDPEDPYKWVQMPDLNTTGIDVNATGGVAGAGYILADDFKCTQTGPLTDIHIWGSWRGDYLPHGFNPRAVAFTLSIHADSLDPQGYSIPGGLLWLRAFQPGEFTARIWASGIREGWMNPPEDYSFPADSTCWQYNFLIDEAEAFYQEGTEQEPIVYWLDVQAIPEDPEAHFGWKTSLDHWNDDAVWGEGAEPYFGPWYELIYPPNHPFADESIDLAFVITGGAPPPELDFGDAPDSPVAPEYPTLLIHNGARHAIMGPWLGDATDVPDPEPDGQPTPDAKGDDNDGNDDEDGVSIPILTQGQTSSITFEVNGGGGRVHGWIDFDYDKIWQPGELVVSGVFANGTHSVNVFTPASAAVGQTFARFRITTDTTATPGGFARDGEVEDYEVYIEEYQEELDFGDAPDNPQIPGYPTLLMHNGARHVIAGPWLGDPADPPDPETDGQPTPDALGDDNDGNDDENGVTIPTLVQGLSVDITFEVNGGSGGVVEAWIDFNGDQVWQLAEQIVAGWYPDGIHTIPVTAPVGGVVGQTFARFRISGNGGLTPVGAAQDGEVEDYEVYIEEEQALKWIQRPDLSIFGIDVAASEPFLLADDYLCTEPGWVIGIGIWASWLSDWLPFGEDPEAVTFTLSIHRDIPDSLSPTGYSMPGELLWLRNFVPGEFSARVWADSIVEGWMFPPDMYWFGADSTCWLYKFPINQDEAFYQEGSEDEPVVYWVDLQARPEDADAWFGWKTSWEHWNDDAVWVDAVEPYQGDWYELIYPPNHEYHGESIDLAFWIQSEPGTGIDGEITTPPSFGLYQNVPNPFNPATAIQYEVPAGGGHVRLEIYDVHGRLVTTLVDDVRTGGRQTATWDGKDAAGHELPSGVYFCTLTADGEKATRKMLLLK